MSEGKKLWAVVNKKTNRVQGHSVNVTGFQHRPYAMYVFHSREHAELYRKGLIEQRELKSIAIAEEVEPPHKEPRDGK